jgi:hypothetical protein
VSDDTPDTPSPVTPTATPEEMLADIWQLTAAGLIAALRATPSAALIGVALKFLSDSGVSLTSLRELKRTRGGLGDIGALPIFSDDDDVPAPPTPAASSQRFVNLEAADERD